MRWVEWHHKGVKMISELLKNSFPSYDVILPVSKKKVKFRPMTVREEKILLLAQSTKSSVEAAKAILQVVTNCFDIKFPEKLAIADMEKAFLALRSKSIGEKITFIIKSDNDKKIEISVDIESFELEGNSDDIHKIKLNDEMMLVLRNPDFSSLCDSTDENEEILKNMFKNCFYELQTADNTYKKEDVEDGDLFQFYDYMTQDQLNQFIKFVENIPRLKKTIKYDDLENKKTMTLVGIDCFFAFASAT